MSKEMLKTNSDDNKKRILFVFPTSSVSNDYKYFNKLLPPSDFLSMAAIAESLDYESKITDYRLGENIESEIKSFNPNYLVIDISIANFKTDMELVAVAKNIKPDLITILKGMPFLTYNINAIYENPFIDYILLGESEQTLKEILDGTPNNEILGICYSENMQGVKTEQRPYNENLDDLPLPARHLAKKEYLTTIEVSRGCPYNCFYCPITPYNGNKLRTRTVKSVIDELKICMTKHHIKHFMIKTTVYEKTWLEEFCKQIIENKLKITWETNLIPKSIDENIAKLMSKSGCQLIHLEVESGSEEILKKVGKDLTLEEIRETVKILKKFKIKINNIFSLGLPWETKETIEETKNFAIELDSNYIDFRLVPPYPGTKFFTYAMLNRLCSPNLKFDEEYKKALIKSHKLSKEQITDLKQKAIKQYYLRPKFITNFLIKSRSLTEFLQKIKTILQLIKT